MATYTNSITLVEVENGADGVSPTYDIELSNEKIYKRVDSVESNPLVSAINIVYPYTISFQLFKTEEGERTLVDVDDFNYGFYIIGETNISDAAGGSGTQYGELRSYISSKSSSFANLVFVKNSSTNTITIDINTLVFDTSYGSSADLAGLQKVLQERDIYFLIKVWSENNNNNDQYLLAKAAFSLEFSTPLEVLINNRSFKTIIDNGSMEFTTDGLTVYNKGLKIVDNTDLQNPITLFEYDSGALKIVGSGSFTGEITANSGSFAGRIEASSGSIGGFSIESGGIFSTDENSSIQLYNDGRIIANNIEIGKEATISEYLKLGDEVYICNPSYSNNDLGISEGTVLKSSGVTLTNAGTLVIGQESSNQIIIDSSSSNGPYIGGNSFSITSNGAVFNNITATGKIVTTVFEKQKVQSVGGAMIFKTSFKVDHTDVATQKIYLEDDFEEATNHYVYLINSNGSIVGNAIKVQGQDSNSIINFNNGTFSENDIFSVIDLGLLDEENKPIVIGVNSNDSVQGFLLGRGITISQMNGVSDFELKAFLGDLNEIRNFYSSDESFTKISGYGLYSSNVFLTGSLTTRVDSLTGLYHTYAGINTLNGAIDTKDNSRIVFWAGSSSPENEAIQAAPFKVTEKGSIYASRGEFNGAIISESIIEGSILKGARIYTAEIHGTGKAPGLSLYDAVKGIVFYESVYSIFSGNSFVNGQVYYEKDNNGDYIETTDTEKDSNKDYYTLSGIEKLRIAQNNLAYNQKDFLIIEENTSAIKAQFDKAKIDNLSIDNDTIFVNENDTTGIKFTNEKISLLYTNNASLNLNQQAASFIVNEVSISNDFVLGDENTSLQYKKVAVGYDLYIN